MERTTEQIENDLLVELCREAGKDGTYDDLVQGARSNHHPDDIRDAAIGNVDALVRLRQAFGLPIFV